VTRRGWLLFGGLALIWGIPYLLIRVAVREIPPALLVFGRTAIGAALLSPALLRRGRLPALRARWRPVLAFAAVEVAIPWLLLSDAERKLSSSSAGLLVALVPLVGALLARISGSRQRPIGWQGLGGLILGLCGVAALVGLDVSVRAGWALAEMALVVVGYAAGPIIVARSLAGLPALEVVAGSLGLAALAYAPALVLALPAHAPSAAALGAVAVLGVLCTGAAFVIFFQLIAEVGPLRATVVTYLNPAVAMAAGVGLLGEPMTTGMALGFALILVGSWLATRASPVSHAGEGRSV